MMAAYTDLRSLRRDSYASGPFTRIQFFLQDGQTLIAVPRLYSLGVRGDYVYTLSNPQLGHNFL
jgi:hypothetical protein